MRFIQAEPALEGLLLVIELAAQFEQVFQFEIGGIDFFLTVARECPIFQVEVMNESIAAARPPDFVFRFADRQSEPTLSGPFRGRHFRLLEVDEHHLMAVEAVAGDQGAATVLERKDVERQVGNFDVSSGGREMPAVREKKARLGRSG